jgi:hypothetical protein
MMRGLTSRPRPLCAMRGTEQRASLGGRLSSGTQGTATERLSELGRLLLVET